MFDCTCWRLGFGCLFALVVCSVLSWIFAVVGVVICSFELLCFGCFAVRVFA